MSEQREQVKAMIGQLRARLTDLEEIVDSFEGDLSGYAEKLDRLDDKVYLMEVELEKIANGEIPAAADSEGAAPEEEESTLMEDMKAVAKDLGGFAKDGMEKLDELKGAFDEATSAFRDEEGNNKLAPYLDKASSFARRGRRRW